MKRSFERNNMSVSTGEKSHRKPQGAHTSAVRSKHGVKSGTSASHVREEF